MVADVYFSRKSDWLSLCQMLLKHLRPFAQMQIFQVDCNLEVYCLAFIVVI